MRKVWTLGLVPTSLIALTVDRSPSPAEPGYEAPPVLRAPDLAPAASPDGRISRRRFAASGPRARSRTWPGAS